MISVVVLLGAPGAGKGTQATLLQKKLGVKKLSSGEALRAQVVAGTELGLKAKVFIDEGNLVPDDLLLDLIHAELVRLGDGVILLDGYPRNVAQAKSLNAIDGSSEVKAAIHIDIDESRLVDRLVNRIVCSGCGENYHRINKKPIKADVCDSCHQLLITRSDDQEDKIKTRMAVYRKETEPLIDFYKDVNRYVRVDGEGTSQDVLKRMEVALETVL